MLEFAVFDLEEIWVASINRYRVLLDRGGVEERCAWVRDHPRPQPDDEHLFGMAVTAALVADGRGRRGELLSSAFFVTWCLTYVTRLLARTLPSERARSSTSSTRCGGSSGRTPSSAPSSGRKSGLELLDVLERELRPLRPELA